MLEKVMKPATACREDNNNIDNINMRWQAAAVEKPATFSRDASNSSRNLQLQYINGKSSLF
jgi:hypothetical protein